MGQMRVELLDIDDDAVVAEASQIRDASQCHGRPHAVRFRAQDRAGGRLARPEHRPGSGRRSL